MSDPRALYRELILEHSRDRQHYGPLPAATCSATRHNPLCGDTISIHVEVDGDSVARAHFEGDGCAISQAVAARLTARVRGQSVETVEGWLLRVEATVRGEDDLAFEELRGVQGLTARRRCATLPWEALAAALAARARPQTRGPK